MDIREIVQSDEWRKIYDRFLYRWKSHLESMQNAKTWEEFIEHRARMREVYEMMRMPLEKLPHDDAVFYKDKIDRSVSKATEEVFNG